MGCEECYYMRSETVGRAGCLRRRLGGWSSSCAVADVDLWEDIDIIRGRQASSIISPQVGREETERAKHLCVEPSA
jgi:hypothetical protein